MKDFFENNCDVVKDLLPLYADGGCAAKTAKLVRKHLDMCKDCRAYLRSVKKQNAKSVNYEIPESHPDYKALSRKIRRRRTIYTSVITSALLLLAAGNAVYFITDDR